jgi:hypothetical protein|tara:strand:- start:1298 stop:1588 length:291 start_codon:yes stop_codon:yes gene_type:complete
MCGELIFDLLYDYIDFKTVMKLRITTKYVCNIYDKEHYWKIINLTDIGTMQRDYLIELFKNSKQNHIYNLSNKNRTIISYPPSLLDKLKNTKLLIL